MWFLEGFGEHAPWRDLPEIALPGEFVRLPDFGQHTDGFFPHRPGIARVDPQARLLIGIRAPGADLDTAVGQLVHHGDPLGDPHRMMIGQNRHAEANPDTFGNLTQGAKHDFWAWRPGEPGQEVVLYKPKIIETHLIGQGTLLE